jgi:anti-sigma factor RsiW
MTAPHNTDPADAAWDAGLRGLHQDVLAESVPPTLLETAHRLDGLRQKNASHWRGAGIAASALLVFASGWFANGQLRAPQDGSLAQNPAGVTQEFVRQAGFAYAVYLPEKRHPVEVAAAEQEHLVQWLSKRLNKPLKIPQLGAQGFELVGGRLLPGETGARAQFMFQNQQGQRVTLYLGALLESAHKTAPEQAPVAEFRFASDAAVPSFYWVEQGFGYALSGQVDKATLMVLSNLVYAQIH